MCAGFSVVHPPVTAEYWTAGVEGSGRARDVCTVSPYLLTMLRKGDGTVMPGHHAIPAVLQLCGKERRGNADGLLEQHKAIPTHSQGTGPRFQGLGHNDSFSQDLSCIGIVATKAQHLIAASALARNPLDMFSSTEQWLECRAHGHPGKGRKEPVAENWGDYGSPFNSKMEASSKGSTISLTVISHIHRLPPSL